MKPPPSSPSIGEIWKQAANWTPDLRLLAGLVLVYLALLQLTMAHWLEAVICAVPAAGALWWLAWRNGFRFLGPVFPFELVRMARSGWTTWLRCAYGLILLLALWITFQQWQVYHPVSVAYSETAYSGADAASTARLGEQFSSTIILVQNIAAIVLTSLYLSGSIVEERQKGTLEYLLSTHLRDHEIIFGKLFARLVTVVSILLVGLPVLALVQFWGGVDIRMLAAGFLTMIFSVILIGAISVYCSTRSRSKLMSLLGSNGLYWMLALGFCVPIFGYASSPFFFYSELESRLRGRDLMWSAFDLLSSDPATVSQEIVTIQMTASFVFGQVLIAAIFLRAAVRMLREPLTHPENPHAYSDLQFSDFHLLPSAYSPEELERVKALILGKAGGELNDARNSESAKTVSGNEEATKSLDIAPPKSSAAASESSMWQHPVWQRESWGRKSGFSDLAGLLWFFWLLFLICFGFALALAVFVSGHLSTQEASAVKYLIHSAVLLTAGAGCCFAAFAAIVTISRDREMRTLEYLLMLPEPWWKILAMKWLAAPWRCLWVVLGFLVFWLGSLLTASLHPVAVPVVMLAAAVHIAFFTSFGMWLALMCRTGQQAALVMGGVLLGITFGPWLISAPDYSAISIAISPANTWHVLVLPIETTFGRGGESVARPWLIGLIGVAIFGVGAVLFWWLSVRRLYDESWRSGR